MKSGKYPKGSAAPFKPKSEIAIGSSGFPTQPREMHCDWDSADLDEGSDSFHFDPAFEKISPLRPANWRWRRAQWLLANAGGRHDDIVTQRAVNYLQRVRQGSTPHEVGTNQLIDIQLAHELYEAGGATELELQARLLAGQGVEAIAEKTKIPVPVIRAYEALFFSVLDHLQANGWITRLVIGLQTSDHAGLLKRIAYHGGTLVLEAALPFLVNGLNLGESRPDLTSESGRLSQALRIHIAFELVPMTLDEQMQLQNILDADPSINVVFNATTAPSAKGETRADSATTATSDNDNLSEKTPDAPSPPETVHRARRAG